MKNRMIAAVLACLMILCPMALAEGTEWVLEEIGLTIPVPEDVIVLTFDEESNAPFLEQAGMTQEEVVEELQEELACAKLISPSGDQLTVGLFSSSAEEEDGLGGGWVSMTLRREELEMQRESGEPDEQKPEGEPDEPAEDPNGWTTMTLRKKLLDQYREQMVAMDSAASMVTAEAFEEFTAMFAEDVKVFERELHISNEEVEEAEGMPVVRCVIGGAGDAVGKEMVYYAVGEYNCYLFRYTPADGEISEEDKAWADDIVWNVRFDEQALITLQIPRELRQFEAEYDEGMSVEEELEEIRRIYEEELGGAVEEEELQLLLEELESLLESEELQNINEAISQEIESSDIVLQ